MVESTDYISTIGPLFKVPTWFLFTFLLINYLGYKYKGDPTKYILHPTSGASEICPYIFLQGV